MDSQAPTKADGIRAGTIGVTAAVAALAAYVFCLVTLMGAYAGGSDSSGYLNSAKLLRDGHTHAKQRVIPGAPSEGVSNYAFVPLGFRPAEERTMVPTYPIGLPVLFAAVSTVAGWDGTAPWTIGIHAIAGLLLVYALGREVGLKANWAILGSVILAASPLYLFLSVQTLSDMPALVWVTASVLLAWQSRTRGGIVRPLATGAAFAMAVLVRPSNLLAIVPVLIALGWNWRQWSLVAIGGLPGAALIASYNHAAYGGAFTSGYGDFTTQMRLWYFCVTIPHYLKWLPVLVSPIAVLALGMPWIASQFRRQTLLFGSWIAAICLFYAFYRFTADTWWFLRFVLPAFPAIIIPALIVAQRIADNRHSAVRGWWLTFAIAVAVVSLALPWIYSLHAYSAGWGESNYPKAIAAARMTVPENAVVIAMQTSGAIYYYTGWTIVRFDVLQSDDAKAINNALMASGRPVYAMLFPHELDEVMKVKFPGAWERIGEDGHITLWRRLSPEAGAQGAGR